MPKNPPARGVPSNKPSTLPKSYVASGAAGRLPAKEEAKRNVAKPGITGRPQVSNVGGMAARNNQINNTKVPSSMGTHLKPKPQGAASQIKPVASTRPVVSSSTKPKVTSNKNP